MRRDVFETHIMYQASLPLEASVVDKSYLMMKTLLEMGIGSDVIGEMMLFQGYHPEHVCYFAGPLVVHDLPWKDQLPERLIKAVYKERLELVCNERKSNFGGMVVGNQAAQADVLAAMFPALIEALVNPDCGIPWKWGKVALYCSCEVGRRHKWVGSVEECYQEVDMKPITFKEIETDYKIVAADVRSAVSSSASLSRIVKVAKKPGWGKSTRASATPATPEAKPPATTPRPTTLKRPSTIPSKPIEAVQLNLL